MGQSRPWCHWIREGGGGGGGFNSTHGYGTLPPLLWPQELHVQMEKIHNKHFKPFVHTTDLKSFIRTICSKSSKIQIFNCRIKTYLVKHQMCPKYSLLSPSRIRRTSASALNATTFLGDESEMSPSSPSVSLSENPTSQSRPAGRLSYFHGGGADTEPEAGGSQSRQKSSESLSLCIDGLLTRGNKVWVNSLDFKELARLGLLNCSVLWSISSKKYM